jgi:hypothetical protein
VTELIQEIWLNDIQEHCVSMLYFVGGGSYSLNQKLN